MIITHELILTRFDHTLDVGVLLQIQSAAVQSGPNGATLNKNCSPLNVLSTFQRPLDYVDITRRSSARGVSNNGGTGMGWGNELFSS